MRQPAAKAADGSCGRGEQQSDSDGRAGRARQRPAQAAGRPEPTVRKNFADTAFWAASLTTDKDGIAEVTFTMPENLTAWKIRVWAMGHGTKVGQGEAEVVTKKDLSSACRPRASSSRRTKSSCPPTSTTT